MSSISAADVRRAKPLIPGEHVIVVGAGPAGLTAALSLVRNGARVTVLEASNAVGGLSQTVRYGNYRFDIGGHRFFTKYAPVERLWREILGDEFIKVPRLSRIHYGGNFFDYPLRASNALRNLGLAEALRVMASYAWARLTPVRPELTFTDWVRNRFGRRLFEIFFETYTEKVWGIPCDEIRAEWAAQRIQNLSLWSALLSALPIQRRGDAIRTLIHEFDYPRLGPGQMWEACAKLLEAEGGRLMLNHRLRGIGVDPHGFVARVDAGGPEVELRADHVVSSAPLRSLVDCLGAEAPTEVRAAAARLRYRDFLTVALVLDRADLFPDNWVYIHTPGVKVGRIQNFNNWSAAMVPVPGTTCLGLEYFCFEGDSLWSAPDGDLVRLAQQEVAEIGLAPGARTLDSCVVRMPKAYPIYDRDYRESVDVIREWLGLIPGLHTVGRNGMHKYNNQDHSMLTALLTVENMLGGSHDVWAVNTDYEYHEEQRIAGS